eukprot:3162520-Ditylum_brightwellii.AAC.1
MIKWFDPITKHAKHCTTACIDEFCTHVGADKSMPGALSIGVKFTFPLPAKGRELGIGVMECDYYLLPYISKGKAGFSFYQKLPGDIYNNA